VNLLKEVPGIQTLCEKCSRRFIESQDEKPIFALAPGAMQEAMAELMKVGNN